MESTRPTPVPEIAALFLCGSLLILIGAVALGLFATMGLERGLPPGNSPAIVHSNWVIVLTVAPIVAIGLTALGFFATRSNSRWVWYIYVCGIISGFLLFQGWAAIHAGLGARKGLQVIGLRRVIIITVVTVLFTGFVVFRTFY